MGTHSFDEESGRGSEGVRRQGSHPELRDDIPRTARGGFLGILDLRSDRLAGFFQALCADSIIAFLFSARCNQIEKDLASGHPYARLLYITPESLFSPKFLKSIKIVVGQKELRRLVVDEAHCISVG